MNGKFDLLECGMGNGVTCCNKAVMDGGDYKRICHISPAGNITWSVPVQSVPGDALTRIEHTAHAMEENFRHDLEGELFGADSGRRMKAIDRMMDALTDDEFLAYLDMRFPVVVGNVLYEDADRYLESLYLKRA